MWKTYAGKHALPYDKWRKIHEIHSCLFSKPTTTSFKHLSVKCTSFSGHSLRKKISHCVLFMLNKTNIPNTISKISGKNASSLLMSMFGTQCRLSIKPTMRLWAVMLMEAKRDRETNPQQAFLSLLCGDHSSCLMGSPIRNHHSQIPLSCTTLALFTRVEIQQQRLKGPRSTC